MAIPFKFPDPNDRSYNSPRVIMNQEDILKLYNQEKSEKQVRVTKPVRDWFEDKARSFDWDKVEFTGSQCTLEVEGMHNFHKKQEDD